MKTIKDFNWVLILKKAGNTIDKKTLSSMTFWTSTLRLKGKRNNAKKKILHIFKNAY